MMEKVLIFIAAIICALLPTSTGQCQIQGADPVIPVRVDVQDIQRGVIFRADTTNVNSIQNSQHSGDALNGGPYFTAVMEDSQFVLSLSNTFADYEEAEYTDTMSILVTFSCAGSTPTASVLFNVHVEDTNNNSPRFIPESYSFSILPPIVPGYELTGCHGDIVARDIDLTTQSIIFSIEENPYFEIEYGGRDPADSKNFFAILRATSVIRSLPEPLTLEISAQDVDLTPDPPRTTFTTITIEADANFEFPEEPVFSEAFYTATYGDDHTITHQDISLSQGYDSNVDFFLSGAQSDYFRISQDENVVSIHGQLPSEVLESNEYSHILLVVHAEREHTSGDKATVIVQLPERTPFRLEFEQVSYRGVITDNVLEVQALGFVEPGTEVITATVVGDYTEYFNAEVNGATVAITMSYLPDQIIEQNNFISIIIEATSGSSSASAVVVFDIIKHDTTTPVFDEIFYVGSYDTIDGVQITNMQLSQGYDENVQFVIDGDGSEYFDVEPNGDSASLILVTPIPQDVISSQHQLTFTIRATKPWTVGASATISIVLPAARILRFEEDEYRGSIQGEELISPPITLIDGYQEDVTFSLSGEYATFFEWENTNNVVTLSLSRDIEVNDIIVLILEATGINAVPSKTAIVLNVVKDDTNTPVFSERVYNGIYFESHEVAVEAAITLSQGYDDTVNVFLEGGYSAYFDLVSTGNSYNLVVISPLPTNVMEEQSQLILTVVASKFHTVGAHAAILLRLTQARDLDFEDDFYEGTLEGESVSLPTIILYEGFREDVAFSLEGDLATFFDALNTGNEVTIRSRSALPADVLETNSNVVMTLQAYGEGARVASTVIVLDIIGPDVTTPVFDKYVYTAQYNEAQITVENINLIQGFDDTVSFRLEGDFSEHLNVNVDSSDNSIILGVTSPLPAEVIDSNTILVLTVVADKPGTVGANAALNVELPRELLQFSDTIYIGLIENSILQLEDITLSEGYNEGVSFHLSGDYQEHFIPSNFGNIIRIEVLDTFTPEIQDANALIVLELHATSQQAISASTNIIIEIVKDSATVISPIFSHSFYPGTYSALTGLQLDEDISLSQGFDDSVTFALTGEHSQYFEVQSEGNSVNLLNPTPIPSAVLAEYSHLIFTIIANKPGTPGARSAISISLTDDMSTAAVLRFEQISYSGILDGTNMQMDQIIQVAPTTYEGEFVLTIVGGVYASYFTVSSIDNLVTIDILNPIPEDIINENAFIVLELKVSGQQAISGQTVVVFETVKDSGTVISPIFSHSFYPGTYSALTGLQLDEDISLSQGFDDSVTFALTGEHSQYFEVQSEGNSVNLLNPTPIPSAVLAENSHLIFTIIANKPGTPGARSAISISLTDDMSTAAVLRFEQISYSGILYGTNMQMDQIIQVAPTTYEGEFVLTIVGGVYASYFRVSSIDNLVTIDMLNPIPEDIINENAFIVLELKVSGQQAISGQTVVVFETVKDSATVISPIFSHSFYPGTYSALTGLQLDEDISLSQGFDDSVTFALTGEHSQYFEVQSEGNSVNLLNPMPIPSAVLAEYSHLIFTIIANNPGTPGARSAISISLTDDMSTAAVLRFEQISYSGILDGTNMQMDQIIQVAPTTYEGEFVLTIVGGVYASYFRVSSIDNLVTIDMLNPIPEDIINENAFIVLELKVSGQQAISGQTVVVFETVKDSATVISPIFSHSFYPGTYSALTGLQLDEDISLSQGFDDSVTFALTGEHSQYFEVQSEGNSVNLLNPMPIPSAVLAEYSHLIFTIIANKPGTPGARSAISISLTDDMSTAAVLRFEQISYSGILDGTNMQMDQIIQVAPTTYEGEFVLTIVGGVYASYFRVSSIDNLVTIDMLNPIPEDIINENAFIVLELKVSGQQAISGQTVVVFETVIDSATVISPIFSHSFYPGTYSALTGLQLDEDISLSQGFDDSVTFALTGEHSQYFEVQSEGNSVNLLNPTPIPSAVLAEYSHLIFTIIANKPGTPGARSAISISLTDDMSTAAVLRFEQISYSGILDGTNMQMDQIIQVAPTTYEGEFVLTIVGGVYASYFRVSSIDNLVTIDMLNPIPEDIINENAFIVLELKVSGQQAISGQTVVVFETVKDSATVISPIFSHSFYPGTYSALTGLQLDEDISLSQGFDDSVTFALTGEHSQYFEVQSEGNSVNLLNPTPIPSAVLAENSHLIFTIIANKPGTPGARSAISISLTDGSGGSVSFDRALYTGSFEQGVTNHEPIFVYGFTGTEVHISGDYSSELRAAVSEDGQVEVLATEGASVPAHIAYLPLLLQADTARTALVLSVIHPISPDPPSVTFEHDSYVLRTDVAQSGLLARLTATANNGETIVYSLVLDNSHLEERLSVSSDGDLWLSAPADSGVYQFSVRATTIATQVSAEATVHLTVDSVVVCGDENRVLQPLIVLERDEEEPHDNLIILNEDLAADCSYEFTYRWPSDRDWIYINEQGHISARIIDREDPAIAFMALSQIQIELVLTCSNDDIISRQRRDVFAQNRTLGPYDYGQSDWILTEGIGYNARRSFVNLIVNDINDNPPIFIRKEDEPIIVGYPVESLLEVVNPSPLIIVQATDADIGVNAELVYWSSATELAVSSRTGAVYVRDNAAGLLQSGTIFTISATDLAGAPGGHTGHIDIMVRLLELDNIIVLSIRNALLDDEQEIIKLLSEALQYDIKSLGATVISDQYEVEDESDVSSRLPSKHFYDATFSEALNVNFTKRLERLAEVDESGATLRIFIYGLLNSEVVEAAQLKSDIEHSEILEELTTFQVQHLQEHLDNIIRVIGSPGGNTGLLVSTIVLACLLFIVIVAIGSWFFFKWWKARKYKQFRDSTSVSNETLETLPKLEDALRPRPKIEEIKRTERRLKQMLEQPVVATPPVAPLVEIETRNGTMDMPTPRTVTFETVSEQPTQPDKPLPIVIQSIDKLKTDEDTEDEDEFGEKLSTRRKSVVTFNEQVEKIITVDNIDPDDDADVIVERL